MLLGEVGVDFGDEDAISKMESEQMRQKLSACQKALELAKHKFYETGGYHLEVLDLGKRKAQGKE